MPGERSLYRKIQVTIEYAEEGTHKSVDALEEHIYRRSPTNFVYYWRDDTDTIRHDYSRNSIQETIRTCVALGVIKSSDGGLTQLGVSASDPRRFPTIVGNRVSKLLSEKGHGMNVIKTAIEAILKGPTPKPPTADEIWSHIGNSNAMDLITFKRLLNLLGECKLILQTQKRIYLPLQ